MDKEEMVKCWYSSLCTYEEANRIIHVSSASDYLLKIRADAVLDNTRIYRVFLSRMLRAGNKWSFSKHFDVSPFNQYIRNLVDADYVEANKITAGFVFCDNPNGAIEKTEFGNIITISESLRYFLYFMNIAILDFEDTEVPQDVRSSAIKIAIRTMLQRETLDFDIDPRGGVPEEVHKMAQYFTDSQLEFVIGHEFSHHFLGHLDKCCLIDGKYFSVLQSESEETIHKFFSYEQQEEFDADIDAIDRPVFTPDMKASFVNKALFFFIYLDIYQSVKSQIFPPLGILKTHPDPIDRFNNLLNHFKDDSELDSENIDNLLKVSTVYKEFLCEDVAINFDSYELYGSIYLGQWRGKVLVDRIDF